jgi:hypothetical protein
MIAPVILSRSYIFSLSKRKKDFTTEAQRATEKNKKSSYQSKGSEE